MAGELADLVTPDQRPVNDLPDESETESMQKKQPRARKFLRAPRAGDMFFAACGLGLAGLCAVFPWYIFFNQEQFGIRPLTFSGGQSDDPAEGARSPEHPGTFASMPNLDPIPTGAVPDEPAHVPEEPPQQPFPGREAGFRLHYVANGRAMIEDDDGFWIVQHGSRLPDGSRVSEILHREGTWVLVTSRNKEVALSQ